MKLVPLITLPLIDGSRRTLESCKDEHNRIPVLNDRELTLDLLIYDSNGNIFDDASSLQINWSTDDISAAEFLTENSKYVPRKADSSTKSNGGVQLYEILHVYPNQLPVTVTATIISYKDPPKEQVIEQPISAHFPMMTIPAPVISPNILNMFVHRLNQLTLAVAGGTQHFILKSSGHTDLKFSPPADIKVTPKTEGEETVHLYDACLDIDRPAEANLLLSDIYAVHLLTADKVEIGQNIEAKCTASDKSGNQLAVSDTAIKEINLQLKLSLSIVDIGKEITEQVTQKKYVLTGKSVGITSLTCQAIQLSGNEISSKSADVQVFSPIELDPKYVLLIVGSTYQIHSRGGPRPHSTTVYSCENETVAGINQVGLVTANVIGKTVVTGQAKGVIIYSQDETIVEVIQLKGFKISLKSRNLITNTEIGVLTVGITDEGPFTFATSPPYLQFHWTSSNHKVAVVESLHYKAGVSIATDKDFRAVIRVLSPGRVTIKLRVQVLSNDFSQVSKYAKLEDEIQVQVFEQLKLIYPQSGTLLLPNHGIDKLQSNKDQVVSVSYEILPSCPGNIKDSVVVISDNGQITASSSSGTANVLVTAHEDFGFNQTVLVQIEVKPVASITLVSNSLFVITGKEHPSFPIGSTVEFGVTLHDNVARRFDVSRIPLLHTTTRSDVVHVIPNADDSTFSIRAANVGETILKVWDKENPSIADYVRILIAEGIVPFKSTVTLGGTICFRTGVSSGNGLWSSSGNLVSINPQSGVAIGLSLGSTMIHYQEETYSTYTEVTVVPPSKLPIIVDEGDSSNISNVDKNRLFYVAIESTHGSCSEATLPLLTDAIPFSCIASWEEVYEFSVKDVFKIEAVYINGNPACSLTSLTLSLEDERSLSVEERRLILYAKLTDTNSNQEYISPPLNIRFIPKFHVKTDLIVLNAQETSKVVKLSGSAADLNALSISSESTVILIKRLPGYIEVSTNGVSTSNIDTSITFYSPLTKHTAVLPVAIKGEFVAVETPQCPVEGKEEVITWWAAILGESSVWVLAYTVILATIIIVLLLYHVITRKRQVKPIHAPPPYSPYTSYTCGHVQQSPYFNNSPYNTQGSPTNRSSVAPGTLFSVSQ